MTTDQDNNMESLIHSERWDDVVKYLETSEGREEVICLKRDNSYRPLHQVLKQSHCPPLEVIEAILKIFPNEPAEINEDGVTALQYAIAFDEVVDGESGRSMRYSLNVFRGEPFHLPVEHIKAMLQSCPQSASMTYQDNHRRGNNRLCWTIHLAMLYDISKCGDLIQALLNADPSIARPQQHDSSSSTNETYLPLSAACSMGNEVAIQLLLDAYPEAAAFQQENSSCSGSGSYLLHELAVRNVQPIVTKRLIEAHPKALISPALDQYKRLPLHIACNHVQGDTIQSLLEANPSTASVSDSDGNLPLHLALMQKPFLRMFSRLHGDAMKQLLESYPKSVLHTNHLGQLPLHVLHLLINERTLLHSDANITYVMEEEEEQTANDTSDEQIVLQKDKLFQKHSWLHLLVETYRQLWKSHGPSCRSIGHNDNLLWEATNDDEEVEPNMWHAVASIGHLMEMTKFNNLLCKLTKKLSIGTHYDVKALDSNDNTMVHLSCHAPFFVAKVMTHRRNSFPEHLTLRFENDAHGGLVSNNDCENENEYVANHLGHKSSHLAVLLKYIERPLACQMARQHNRDGNLPFHVLLMQPCGRTLPCCPNPANDNHNKYNSQTKCCKFFDMSRLIDLYPASILEGQGCSSLMPFMIAASSCTTNAQEEEECCLQCLSCTFVLLRNGGMEQFHS